MVRHTTWLDICRHAFHPDAGRTRFKLAMEFALVATVVSPGLPRGIVMTDALRGASGPAHGAEWLAPDETC